MKYIVNGELNDDKLMRIIISWKSYIRPELKTKMDYFLGKQAITNPELTPEYPDTNLKRNRIVANYCRNIVQQYCGYNVGVPVTYDVDEDVLNFLKYNDYAEKDAQLFRQGLIYGKSYELSYVDAEKNVRFCTVDAQDCIEVYSSSIEQDELLAFIRFYITDTSTATTEFNPTWNCDVYTKDEIITYSCGSGDFSLLTPVGRVPHVFKQVPVVVFHLNEEEMGCFEPIMSLQDAYNTARSSAIDTVQANSANYLVIKGFGLDNEEDENGETQVDRMSHQRVLEVDADGDVFYLQRPDDSSSTVTTLDNIREDILMVTNCPNFYDEKFNAQSGIALQYKLVGFDDVSKDMMTRFEKALRKRIELFAAINSLTGGESQWRDAGITFTQNIPVNIESEVSLINQLWNKLPKEMLVGRLPFVKDPATAVAEAEKQNQASMDLYDFTGDDEE